MAYKYLDIETEGFNPEIHKIVTIQYQELSSEGRPNGPLIILKEWELGEERIVNILHNLLFERSVWDFIPIGYNLIFDLTFLWAKFKKYGLEIKSLDKFIYEHPLIDIKYSLIIANNLAFKDSGLDKMTKKETDGRDIPNFYKNKEFDKIESYIVHETESFIECLQKLRIKLMEAFPKERGSNNIGAR